MSIVFKELRLKNFLSFGNVEQKIDLTKNDFTLITGINKDKSSDDNGNRNGIGKSSFFNALHYAIFGKAIGNKINLPNLVNNINKKNMSVTLLFENNGVNWRIERGRNPTYLRLYKEDEEIDDESLGDSRDTQSFIESLIGMNDDLFCQTILLSCNVPIFLDQTTSNQKLIIEKVLGVDVITRKIESLKGVIKETKNEINNESFRIETIKSSIESQKANYLKQLEYIDTQISQWENNKNKEIADLNDSISRLVTINWDEELNRIKDWETYTDYLKNEEKINNERYDINNKIISSNNLILSNNNRILQLKSIDVDNERQKILENQQIREQEIKYKEEMLEKQKVKLRYDELTLGFKTLNSEKDKLLALKEQFSNNICPTCHQMMNKEESLKEIEKCDLNISQYNDAIHKVDMEILSVNSQLSSFREDGLVFDYHKTQYNSIEEILSVLEEIKKLELHNKELQDNITQYQSKLNDLTLMEVPQPVNRSLFSNVDNLYKVKNNLDVYKQRVQELSLSENPHLKAKEMIVESMSKVEEVDESQLTKLIYDQEHNEMLLKLLNSPTSFIRQSIMDKSLTFLNNRIKYYLNKLGSLHIVQFNNDMSIDISYMGIKYGYVSSGEMGRISLALTFAFRDAWESLSGIKTNLLMIDEILDRSGLDTNGISMVVECLKENNDKNIFLVSHNDGLNQSITNKITIVKERSFSNIEI